MMFGSILEVVEVRSIRMLGSILELVEVRLKSYRKPVRWQNQPWVARILILLLRVRPGILHSQYREMLQLQVQQQRDK